MLGNLSCIAGRSARVLARGVKRPSAVASRSLYMKSTDMTLAEQDPELFGMIEKEKCRQMSGMELIASENFTSRAVMECLGSSLTNKYAVDQPGVRQYPGCEFIDQIETLCQRRALAAYNLDPNEWGVNVQPYSGSPANMAVYTALLRPHARIMGLDVSSGGHLTHGLYSPGEGGGGAQHFTRDHVAAASKYFESLPYRVSPRTGLIDMKALQAQADMFRPELIICGHSAYPRELEYAKYRKIASSCNALLLCDMAHISGLIAAGEADSPFEHVDLVSTTTHKTLRGPRSGMIFYRKDSRNLGPRIDAAVWPALQGGAHMHQIAAIAAQMKEVMSEDFRKYTRQVKANAKSLAAHMQSKYGYVIPTGGTDNHIVLWDLKNLGITGAEMQFLCEQCGITLSKCALPSDKDINFPTGVRIGTPALTTRGFGVEEFQAVGGFLHRAVELAKSIQAEVSAASRNKSSKSSKKAKQQEPIPLEDFKAAVMRNPTVHAMSAEVTKYMMRWPMPGAGALKAKSAAAAVEDAESAEGEDDMLFAEERT